MGPLWPPAVLIGSLFTLSTHQRKARPVARGPGSTLEKAKVSGLVAMAALELLQRLVCVQQHDMIVKTRKEAFVPWESEWSLARSRPGC